MSFEVLQEAADGVLAKATCEVDLFVRIAHCSTLLNMLDAQTGPFKCSVHCTDKDRKVAIPLKQANVFVDKSGWGMVCKSNEVSQVYGKDTSWTSSTNSLLVCNISGKEHAFLSTVEHQS